MTEGIGGFLLHPSGKVQGLEEVHVSNWLPSWCQQQGTGVYKQGTL